tara:strand:- start:225 stop:647 length:423 start_codon:yes stop_codon:yes gene_type:complete
MITKKFLLLGASAIALAAFLPMQAHADAQIGIELPCGITLVGPDAPPESIITRKGGKDCKRYERQQRKAHKKRQEEREQKKASMSEEEWDRYKDTEDMTRGDWSKIEENDKRRAKKREERKEKQAQKDKERYSVSSADEE